MRAPTSLRARLLWLLLGAITVAVLLQASFTYRSARASADDLFDFQMRQTAMSLRYGLPLTASRSGLPVPAAERDAGFVIQVWSAEGLHVFGSLDAPILPPRAQLGYSDLRVADSTYRLYAVASPTHVIQVAQDMAVRRALAQKLAWRTVAPVAVMAPVLLAIVWLVVQASLAPLVPLRRQLAARQPDDLDALDARDLPDEVQPLMAELNALFARVRQAFDAQQRFVADAAHELRTPLAALKLQVEGLRRATDHSARALAIDRLDAGITRAGHLVDQLLALARLQASATARTQAEPVDLLALVRQSVAEAAAGAAARGVDLGVGDLPSTAADARVAGHADALAILLRNLIDNAVKYAPRGGTVDVALQADTDGVRLSVDDSGPGIADDDRARVFDRFYRGTDTGADAPGSGLGLAIVKAIAELHGTEVELGRSPRLGGLRIALRLARVAA